MPRTLRILAWLLLIIAVILLGMLLNRTDKLLSQAQIPWTDVRSILVSETWTDWLNYIDGYDWAILQVRSDFRPPESWTHTPATLREINAPSSGHYFCSGFINHSALPETFTDWLYIPHDDTMPFEEREWFAAMYDAVTDTLALYRGHTLFGF